MTLSPSERTLLEVVRKSDGGWDTRGIDFGYYSREPSELMQPSILHVLRDMESRGLVTAIDTGGTGPAWRLTERGARLLESSE